MVNFGKKPGWVGRSAFFSPPLFIYFERGNFGCHTGICASVHKEQDPLFLHLTHLLATRIPWQEKASLQKEKKKKRGMCQVNISSDKMTGLVQSSGHIFFSLREAGHLTWMKTHEQVDIRDELNNCRISVTLLKELYNNPGEASEMKVNIQIG